MLTNRKVLRHSHEGNLIGNAHDDELEYYWLDITAISHRGQWVNVLNTFPKLSGLHQVYPFSAWIFHLYSLRQWQSKNIHPHDDVIKWRHFPCYWPFVRGIHQWPEDSPHKGQWHGALMFSLICAWTNGWANAQDASDLECHHAYYAHDVTVMVKYGAQSGLNGIWNVVMLLWY